MHAYERSRLVRAIAVFNAVVYSLASVWYLQMTLDPLRHIQLTIQLSTLLLAIGGITFLIVPRIGYPLMILSTTVVILCARADGDAGGAAFFTIIAFVLLWPLLRNLLKSKDDNQRFLGTA